MLGLGVEERDPKRVLHVPQGDLRAAWRRAGTTRWSTLSTYHWTTTTTTTTRRREGEYEDFDEAALVEELKQRLQRYTLPGLGHTSFQQLNAKAAIAAAHHRAYIQVGNGRHPATAGYTCR